MDEIKRDQWDVVVVGAGISGLLAARELSAAGLAVLVIDKGRAVGGRMAYRRIGDAIFDHGAQYISARSETFQRMMQGWQEQGIAEVWSHGFTGSKGDHPRWRGAPHMKAMPTQLSDGLNVWTDKKVTCVEKNDVGWLISLENSKEIQSRGVIMTPPVPQCVDLFGSFYADISSELRAEIERLKYHRCFAVMAVLDGPSGLERPGVKVLADGPVAWIADNQIKGISPKPCVTLHASHEFSLARWEEDRQETAKLLLEAASPFLTANVTEFQIHGWRYSKPIATHAAPVLVVNEHPYLALAGDAFGGTNVEGAVTSGLAAAKDLMQKFSLL